MPLLLLIVDKRRWDRREELNWLSQGDIPADPLGNLKTLFQELSVWHIDDDRSNLGRVIAALAAMRERFTRFDYALFDLQLAQELSIEVQETPGTTPDTQANIWHRDLVQLSADTLVRLAKAMWSTCSTDRVPEGEVARSITEAVELGRIALSKLNEKMRAEVSAILGPSRPRGSAARP